MKKLFLGLCLLSTTLITFAGERTFSLNGKYVYNGDGKFEEGDSRVIFFPSELRNDTENGYQNYERPPMPWYAKIPQKTDIVIRDLENSLEIDHTALFGGFSTSPRKDIITSPVDLTSMGKETIEVNNSEKSITFTRKDGNIIAGQKVFIKMSKMANGDIQVTESRKGWAPLPVPGSITIRNEYFLRRK